MFQLKSTVAASLLFLSVCATAQGSAAETEARVLSNAGKNLDAIAVLDADRTQGPALSARLLKIYLLTDTQQFELAVTQGKQLATAAPENADALLAYAYALRHSGNKSLALKAYQEAGAVAPASKDALIGQVLMLSAVGAPILALELAANNKLALPPSTLNDLRHAQAIQFLRLAPAGADQLADRVASLGKAVAILRELSETDASRTPDLIAALSRNGEHDEALKRYGQLGAAAPAWLWPDVANSYAAKKDFGSAVRVLEQAVTANPAEQEYWTALFYLYSDTAQAVKAQELIDSTLKRCEAQRCASLETALTLQVYSRLWADDVPGARKLVTAGLASRPASAGLQSAYVAVLNSSGLKRAARDQVNALVAQSPDTLDFQLSRLTLEDPESNAVKFEAELQVLETAFAGDAQVARLRNEWERSRAPAVKLSYQVEKDESSTSTKTRVAVTSAALNAQGLRLAANTSATQYTLAGKSGKLASSAVGIDVPLTFGTELQARLTSTATGAGFSLEATHQWSDALSVGAELSVNSDDVPIKAIPFGTKLDVLGANASYRLSETQELGGSVRLAELTDGNQQTGVSLSYVKTGAVTPEWGYRWTNRVGADTSSNQNVSYFSPSSVRWAESEYRLTHKVWLTGDTFVTLQPRVSAGVIDQASYSPLPFASLGLSLSLRMGPNATLEAAAGVAKKPFDGAYSTQTLLNCLFYWRWI